MPWPSAFRKPCCYARTSLFNDHMRTSNATWPGTAGRFRRLRSAKSRLYQLTWAFGRPRRRFVGPRIAATRAPPTEPTNTRGAIRPARALRARARPAPIDAELRLWIAAPSHKEGSARPGPTRCEGVRRCSARPTREGSISSAAPIEGSPSPGTRDESFR